MSQSTPPSSATQVSEPVVASETQGSAQQQPTEPSQTDTPIQAQPHPPRKIDENTDINTLTDEEIRQLNEQAVTNAMQVQDERVGFTASSTRPLPRC
jgi:Cu/Ag efflux protein CusF